MAHITRHGQTRERDQVVFAMVLVVIGLIGVLSRVWQPSPDIGGWVVLVIGLGFLGIFGYTRRYGYVVPAGIMTGLGAGIIVARAVTWTTGEGEGGAVVLGLGLGFLSILVLQSLATEIRNAWWPTIPGGILSVVGAALLIGGEAAGLLEYWGLAVVAIGLILLWRALAQRSTEA
jgi:hypothetical protein